MRRVLVCSPMQWRQEEERDQNLLLILAPGIKRNGWKAVEVLCNFLNFWIQGQWMEKLFWTLFLSTSSSLLLDFRVCGACASEEPGDWSITGSPRRGWLHFLGYIKSKLPNKLSAGSVYHIAIEQFERRETSPGWKNNDVTHGRSFIETFKHGSGGASQRAANPPTWAPGEKYPVSCQG